MSSLSDGIVEDVVQEHREAVQRYKNGQSGAMNFLVGQVVVRSSGRIDPSAAKEKLIEELGEPTEPLAVRAARIIDCKENGTRFEPNISDDPKKQYVDVFPDPHERAAMDYWLHEGTLDALRNAGIVIRYMTCGRERSDFNEANYRIWFKTQ